MRDVLVNGVFVIRDGELDMKAFPGQPVRQAVSQVKDQARTGDSLR
jgi:hypothetical protein